MQPHEIQSVADECAQAWTDATIPERQYQIVKPELEAFRHGQPVAPYDALVKAVRHIPMRVLMSRPSVLDVGASSGYYREVLQVAGFQFRYRGVDYSSVFQAWAEKLYPGIDFDVANACALPYRDETFDVVLHGACIMHCAEYQKAIEEAARVSKRYVIFHRTPILVNRATTFYQKEAYDVPCLEIWFNEAELLALFEANGLHIRHTADVFFDGSFGHRTYLLESLNHVQV